MFLLLICQPKQPTLPPKNTKTIPWRLTFIIDTLDSYIVFAILLHIGQFPRGPCPRFKRPLVPEIHEVSTNRSSFGIPATVSPGTHGPFSSPSPNRPAVERPVGAERRVPVISLERAAQEARHRFGGAGQNMEPVWLRSQVDHMSVSVPSTRFGHRRRVLPTGTLMRNS